MLFALSRYRFVLVFALVLACGPALGGDGAARTEPVDGDTLKAVLGVRPEDHPEAHAVIIRDHIESSVDEQWRVSSTQYILVRIIRQNGVQQFKEVNVPYNPDYQKVSVLTARTIFPNGTATTVKEEAVRSVDLPTGILKTNMKALNVVFPGVSVGVAVEYRVRLENVRNPMGRSFMDRSFFGAPHPIIDCRYVFSAPKGVPFHHKQYRLSLTPVTKNENGVTTTAFHAKDLPAIELDPRTPPATDIIPNIVFGSRLTWDDVAGWAYPLMSRQVMETGPIKQAADRLSAALRTGDVENKVRTMYYLVSQSISYVAFEYGKNAWEPHAPTDVITNKYGDCKDGATLLVSLLRSCGVPAYQVLIRTAEKGPLNRDFPYAGQFNHCIAAVPKPGGGYWWLDTTTKVHMFGDIPAPDQGCEVMILKGNKAVFETVTMSSMDDNVKKADTSLSFDAAGRTTISSTSSDTGVFKSSGMAEGYRLKTMEKDKLEEQMRRTDPTVELVAYDNSLKAKMDLDAPFTSKLEYRSKNVLVDTGHALVLDIGKLSPFRGFRFEEKREHDYLASSIQVPYRNVVTVSVAVPAGFTLSKTALPPAINRENDFVKVVRRVTQKESTVSVVMELGIKKTVVPVKDYPSFTRTFDGTSAVGATVNLVFLKKGMAAASGKSEEEKEAQSLFSSGKSFLMNNMGAKAREAFEEIIAVYPNTKAARMAKLELAKMK